MLSNWKFFNYLLLVSCFFLTPFSTRAADNLFFDGELVAEPCTIAPGEENIELNYGVIVDKNLYSYPKTNSQPFTIKLNDCDLSLGKMVSISFGGDESLQLPGHLNISIGGKRSGAVIGLETQEGTFIPINKDSDRMYPLTAGSTLLKMQAYVRGEPEAIENRSIARGEFNSIVTFYLHYE